MKVPKRSPRMRTTKRTKTNNNNLIIIYNKVRRRGVIPAALIFVDISENW